MSRTRTSHTDAQPVLTELRKAREAALTVRGENIQSSDQYGRATVLLHAIDNLAEAITGDPETLWSKPHR